MSILKLLALINIGYISLIFGLATRSRFVRIYICFPLSFLVFSHVAFVDSLDQPTPNDRLNPCVVGLNGILRAFELLLCSGDPYIAFVRLEDKKKDIKVVEQSYWARIKWALSLSCSQRGGGWNWRVAGAPRLPPRTTTVFVLHSFIRWISNYLGLELLSIIFGYLGSPVTLRGPLVILHAVMVYTALHATYEPGCIAWVLLGFGSMEECPPLYGKLRDAKTLKGFWGKSWHQCFRQSITVIPNQALAAFGIGPDTTGISAFFITGMFHAATIYAMTHGAIYPCFKTFLFFALQPLGFWIEGHVLGLRVNDGTRSNGTSTVAIQPRGTSKTAPDSNQTPTSTFVRHPWLGYVWVTTWLCLTARLYFGEMVASGFYDQGGWVAIPILTRFVSIARHA